MGFFDNAFKAVKSAYQKNVQQPTTQITQPKTTRDVLNQINILRQTDKASADEYTKKLMTSMQDPTSRFYNPYTRATNKAVSSLASMGFDVSDINDDWYNQNSWLKQYYKYTANTNGLSSTMSNKRASAEEKAAYQYNQLWMAEENTKKAETEWSALQQELSYWAQRKDRNYSDDEIIGRIDWSKYKTLQKMDETRQQGTPLELNRAIGYSDDAMYGVLWAARNGGSTGNQWLDMANSATGTGWQENAEIAAKLNIGNPDTYSPYSVGSTMEKEGLYFDRESFDQKWLDENRAQYLAGDDETAKKMYQSVWTAEKYTQKLESQLSDMRTDIDELTKIYDDPEKILEIIKDDKDAYGELFKLDDSMESGILKDTTRAVDYRWKDIEQEVRDRCAKQRERKNAEQLEAAVTGVMSGASDAEKALEAQYKANMEAVGPTIQEKGTQEEKDAYTAGKTGWFDRTVETIRGYATDREKLIRDNTARIAANYLDGIRTTYDYEGHQKNLETLNAERDSISGELEALQQRKATTEAIQGATREEYARLMDLANTPEGENVDWDMIRETLSNGPGYEYETPQFYSYDEALDNFYRMVALDDRVNPDKALAWFNYISEDHSTPMEKLMADAQSDQSDTDEFSYDVDIPGRQGQLTVNFERNADGKVSFVDAVDQTTGKAYGSDRMDEINALLGYNAMDFLTDDESARLDLLEARDAELAEQIEAEEGYLQVNESLYQDAKMDRDFLLTGFATTAAINELLTGEKADYSLLTGMERLYAIGQTPVKTQWLPDSAIDLAVQSGELTKEQAPVYAANVVASNLQEADRLNTLLNELFYYGVTFSEEEKSNILGYEEELRKSAESASYCVLDGAADFKQVADETYQKVVNGEINVNVGNMVAKAINPGYSETDIDLHKILNSMSGAGRLFNLKNTVDNIYNASEMTEDEWNRFYYLLGKDGEAAAQKYLNMLMDPVNGAVTVRSSQDLAQSVRDYASENGWNAATATALSFGAKVIGGVSDIVDLVGNKVFGTAYSPYGRQHEFSVITEAARGGTKELINKTFGEDSTAGKALNLIYDAGTSFGDSMINSVIMSNLLGDIFGGTKFETLVNAISDGDLELFDSKIANGLTRFGVKAGTDLAHASGMGFEAAASAYREAYISTGGDREKASQMALWTFLAETGSEAITFGNLHSSFAAGGDEAKRGFVDFFKNLFTNGLEEFVGEGANEWIEQNADRLIMGADSKYEENAQGYIDQGYPRSLAEELANRQMWKDIWYSGVTGFVSSTFGTSIEYAGGAIQNRKEKAAEITPENVNGPVQAAEPVTNQGTEQTENTPEITQENVNAAEEAAPATTQPTVNATPEVQEQMNDNNVLENAYGAAPEAAAAAITSILGPDTNTNKAASKAWVSRLAGGNTKLAVRVMQEVQRVSELKPGELKKALRYASLTDGTGNQALQSMFSKVASGIEITAADVNTIRDGIQQDRTSDPTEFNRKYNKAVRDSRIADRTVEIASAPENKAKVENAERGVKQARAKQAQAEQHAEATQSRVDAVADSLAAAEAEYDPQNNPESAGPLEQTRNELMGADSDAQTAENQVEIQRQKTQEAQEALETTRNEVMAEARAQAVTDVDQQIAQEEQEAYETGVSALAPVVPTGRTVTVLDNQGNEVKITGVYDVLDDGRTSTIVYTTADGGTITSDNVNESTIPADLIVASDRLIDNDLKPENRPVAYFPQSIPMTVDGQQTQAIGVAGKQTVDGMTDPVIMDASGRTYSVNDVDIDYEYADIPYDVLTANEDSLPEIPVAKQEESVNDNQGSEREGTEPAQTGSETDTDTEGPGIQRDNGGELPVDAGSDVGRGGIDNAGSGRGQEDDGHDTSVGSETQRQTLRGVPQRLLSKETTKALKEKGVTDLKLSENTDQQRFSSALDEAKANNDHGAYVDAQSVESLQEKGAITILSENGLAGAAVGTNGTEAGNIFGVFKNARSRARKASAGLMIAAIARGGNKLDCFDGDLRKLYSRVGMIPVARVAFNEEFMPDGWNVERDDHPDVVFWMHNGNSVDTVAQKYGLDESEGGYHIYTADEIQALPLFEDVTDADGNTAYGYDRAWEYRDQQLANRQKEGYKDTTAEPVREYLRGQSSRNNTATQQQAQKTKGKLNSPQQIAKTLIKSLGFGDYTGSNNFGGLTGTLGYWERHAQLVAVKNKEMGNYATTMHEAGHGIAQLLGLQNAVTPQMVANMIAEDPRFTQYSPNELKGEAFAEFFWRYLEDDQRARDFAGDTFVDTFERELAKNPNASKSIREARGQLQQWVNADTDAKVDALVRYEKTGERSKFRSTVRSVINWLSDKSSIAEDVNQFVRDAKGTKELDISDDLRAQSLLTNHSQKRALVNLTDNLTDADGNIIGDGLGKRLADVGFKGTEENIHLLERYALLKHSIDRDVQNKPVFGNMPQQERLNQIAEIERTRPDIVAAEQAWQSFRRDFLQAWMVDTGYWQQGFLDQLEQTYPHYVPTFRIREGAEGTMGVTRPGKRYTLHEATGGSQDIYSPYYSFIGMVDQITSMVAQNKVAQTFDKLYNEVEGMGIFGRQIPGALDTKVEPGTTLNNRQQQLMNLLGGQISDDIMQQVLDITKSKYGVDQSGQPSNLLNVQKEDGTVVQYEIDNPELFKLLTGVQAASGMRVLQAVGNLTRTMSMLTTGSNPLFAARNAVRDYQNSVNYGSWASNYLSGIPKWISALVEVAQGKSDAIQAYKALGGGGWTRIEQNSTKSMKEIQNEMFGDDRSNVGKTAKWLGKKLWDIVTMDKLNEWIEQTSRFVEYKYGKHDLNTTEGRQKAFLAAQDVTVDFSRSGNSEAAYVLKKLIPFFNASMQGVYRTGRQLTEAERGRAGTRLAKTVVNTALTSALAAGLILKYGDDDDKEEFRMLSDGIKANHLILPNPFKETEGQPPFIRIPLSQDAVSTFIHGLVTNSMMEGSPLSDDAIALSATADTIVNLMNPLGDGTILQPFIDVSHNRTWFGSNIVRSGMTDWTDKPSQYNEDTPEVFKTLGRLLNQSPEIVEYLFQQYTGFIGAVGSPALTLDNNGELGGLNAVYYSIVKKWTADPSSSNDVTKDFYNMKNTISTIASEAKSGRPQGLLLRSLSQEQVDQAYEEAEAMQKSDGIIYETNKLITDTYAKIDQINSNSTLTDNEKYELTRAAKLDMLKQVQSCNEQLAAYNKKYIQGETLMDRLFSGLQKRTEAGTEAHIKTPEEKLPAVFQNDEPYMQKSREVYKSTGKATALPHPSQKLTITDRSGNENEYTISGEDWDRYTEIYDVAYQTYITQKGKRWDTLNETEKQKILTGAHTAGNKAMREQYARENGIRMK